MADDGASEAKETVVMVRLRDGTEAGPMLLSHFLAIADAVRTVLAEIPGAKVQYVGRPRADPGVAGAPGQRNAGRVPEPDGRADQKRAARGGGVEGR